MLRTSLVACLVLVTGLAFSALSPWIPSPATSPGGTNSYIALSNGWSIAYQRGGSDSGRLHIVYEKNDLACYRYSTDNGRSWSDLQVISSGSATREMPVLACRLDTVTVAWPELIGSEWHIKQCTNVNAGAIEDWGDILITTNDEDDAFWNVCPSLAMWSNDNDFDYDLKTSISYTCSLDNTPKTCDAYHTYRYKLQSWHEEDINDNHDEDSSAMMVSVSGRWDDNDGHFGFQRWDGSDNDWEIWYAQGWSGTENHSLLKLTDNTGANKSDDLWPSSQCFRNWNWSGGPSVADSLAAIAYHTDSSASDDTTIIIKVVHKVDDEHEIAQEFSPLYNTNGRRPNIWYDSTAMLMLMGYVGWRGSGPCEHANFTSSYVTDSIWRGWFKPVRISSPYATADRVHVCGNDSLAFAFVQHPGATRTMSIYLAPDPAQDVTAFNTSSGLVCGPDGPEEMYRRCAFEVPDRFVAVERSTDGGAEWEYWASPGWGQDGCIGIDAAGELRCAFVRDETLYCSVSASGELPKTLTVFEGSSTVKLGDPSMVSYSVSSDGVCPVALAFAVYDQSTSSSILMFAKVDTGRVVLDTIETLASLADSFPTINIYQTDSLYVVWERSGAVVSSEHEFGAGTWTQPATDWSSPTTVASAGKHPMSVVEENYLHAVWRYLNTGTGDIAIRTASFELGDNPAVGGWQNGSDPSEEDSRDKTNPCRTQAGVTVWQEEGACGIWRIMAGIRGDTVTIAAPDSNCLSPQALADSSVPSPSINQVRLRTMWFEEYRTDTCSLAFRVDTFNVSDAGSDATESNNGSKLIRKSSDDSLFAVYQDADGATMYAWSEDGSEWQRQQCASDGVYPAVTSDGTGRRWVVYWDDGAGRVFARFDSSGTFSAARELYNLGSDQCGPISVAGSHDPSNSCAYAVFRRIRAAENDKLILVKFDASNQASTELYEGDEYVHPCIGTEWDSGNSKDDIHLSWERTDLSDVFYTMTSSPVDPTEPFPTYSWETDCNLSSSDDDSKDPSMHVGSDRVIVAWSEHATYDVVAVRRDLGDTYDDFEDTVNLSESAVNSLYPVVCDGDSAIVVWEEQTSGTDHDIYCSVEFESGFAIEDNAGETRFPHAIFQNKASGDSAIPYIHLVFCEEPDDNYYEVGYTKYNIKESGTGGGGAQSGPGSPRIVPMLHACRPNPFANRTLISYQFLKAGNVSLKVFDISGRTVRTLQRGHQEPGVYNVTWDGRDDHGRSVAHGVYYYQLVAPGFRDVRKAVLAR